MSAITSGMRRRSWRRGGAACIAAVLGAIGCSETIAALEASEEREVLVFAAASTREALAEIATAFARVAPDVQLTTHVAGSSALRHQIAGGAPADVFVSADAAEVRALGDAVVETHAFARNRLVVVAGRDQAAFEALRDLRARPGRIAVGNTHMAPVGRHARAVLEATELALELEPRLVPCDNAPQIVRSVASGSCSFGLTYRTDARSEPRVHVVWTIDDALHAPIVYVAARLRHAAHPEAARAYVRFLTAPVAAEIFERHGFSAASRVAAAHGGATTATDVRARFEPVWLSLRIASIATLCSAILGLGLAAWLARRNPGFGRDLVASLADLPLVLPPTVLGLVLLELCGPRGPLGALAARIGGLQLTFTWGAAVLASAVMALPLMVRSARAALESVPARYVDAARTLGATPWSAFWSVQLPLARRGVVAGVVLCFFRALGEFGATLMVAGNIPGRTQTLPLAIYSAVFEGRARDAVVWVAIVLVLSWCGALVAQRLARRAPS